MSISNLHTILNRPWYIEQNYGAAHLPLVLNLLNGTSNLAKEGEEDIVSFVSLGGGSKQSSSSSLKQVAIISIKNPIVKHDQFCGPQGTKSMTRELESLKSNESVSGVVLDIDSGGGQAYGTPEFHDYLLSYPKPVVAYTDGLMCSAAYYIGSAASHIVANKRAEAIGSIGAYTQILDMTGFYAKKGAKLHTIYATKSTEKNQAYREVLEGNYEDYIKKELDPLVETFHADMLSARPNLSEATLKGGTWVGNEAINEGLVDELGTLQTAIDKVFELADKNNTNSNTMSTERQNLQTVLGLEAPLASTDNGSYLNEEQLTAVETALGNHAQELQTATTNAATLQTTVDDAATADQALIDQVNTSLELEGDDQVATVADAITALETKITDLGEQPGDTHTKIKNNGEDNEALPDYVDLNCSIYKLK